MSLDSLYQETILDHYKNPRNQGVLNDAQASIHQENPSCGDQIDLRLVLDADNRIQTIKFVGHGCAISQASASMMTEAVEGKTLSEVREIIDNFRRMLLSQGKLTVDLGDLEALEGVKKFPVRVKCATLAWTALEKLLQQVANSANA